MMRHGPPPATPLGKLRHFAARDRFDVYAWWIAGALVTGILSVWLAALWAHSIEKPISADRTPADILRPDAQRPVATYLLNFVERGMDIELVDPRGKEPGRHLGLTSHGFIVILVRSMNRERRRLGLPIDAPYRLSRWDNQQIMFEDPETGTQIELAAFGGTNAAAFTALIEGQPTN